MRPVRSLWWPMSKLHRHACKGSGDGKDCPSGAVVGCRGAIMHNELCQGCTSRLADRLLFGIKEKS